MKTNEYVMKVKLPAGTSIHFGSLGSTVTVIKNGSKRVSFAIDAPRTIPIKRMD